MVSIQEICRSKGREQQKYPMSNFPTSGWTRLTYRQVTQCLHWALKPSQWICDSHSKTIKFLVHHPNKDFVMTPTPCNPLPKKKRETRRHEQHTKRTATVIKHRENSKKSFHYCKLYFQKFPERHLGNIFIILHSANHIQFIQSPEVTYSINNKQHICSQSFLDCTMIYVQCSFPIQHHRCAAESRTPCSPAPHTLNIFKPVCSPKHWRKQRLLL